MRIRFIDLFCVQCFRIVMGAISSLLLHFLCGTSASYIYTKTGQCLYTCTEPYAAHYKLHAYGHRSFDVLWLVIPYMEVFQGIGI